MTWRYGGAYMTDNVNAQHVFVGCYSEGGQVASQFTYPTLIVGGGHYTGAVRMGYGTTYGGWVATGNEDGLTAYRDLRIMGALKVGNIKHVFAPNLK